ncbi:MAG TPA: acetylxylan esterase [Bryobacteraceae bacterium]|nr:acetylxylan esterase [Bryobacteraceae bacterium]
MNRTWLFLCIFGGLAAAEEFRALDPQSYPAPQAMLSSYLQDIAQKQLANRRRDVEAIASKEVYEQRKARLRAAALRMIGGLSEERTPLNLRTTGTLDRGDYRVDKIVYESRPNFFVTANLYVPRGAGPFPAVLQPIGHSVTGKNRAFYQRIALALVKEGFVVLTYDPIGQGERRVFWDKDLDDSKVGGPTVEHSMVGWQSLLGGESLARFRVWDGLRSIDLLTSLREVDAARIGVTGCSGGGTLTTYIAALDERVKAAAPACYISSWEDQLKGTGPQDAEQEFPDQLLHGLDHADWIGLAGQKPYLIVSTDQDFFPLEGARKTFTEMKRIYALYDAAAKIQWFHEPGGHGVPPASRQAITGFMKQWLKGDFSPVREPELIAEHEEDLNATATGQVATSLGGETASANNMRRFSTRIPPRPHLAKISDLTALRTQVRQEVRRLTRFERSAAPLAIRRGSVVNRDGLRIEMLTFQAETGLTIPAALIQPAAASPRGMVLYLDPRGKSNSLTADGDIPQLAKLGYGVFAVDVSGTGEVAFARNPSAPWSSTQVAWLALMVGKPITGIRMNDIVRGLDALQEIQALPAAGVRGFARGKLGPVLLHAAAIDERINGVILEDSLLSYAAVGSAAVHRDIEDVVIPGILGRYDLPDLVAAIAPRPVYLSNLRSPRGNLLLRREAEAAYQYPLQAYRAVGKPGALAIGLRRDGEPVAAAYPGLK